SAETLLFAKLDIPLVPCPKFGLKTNASLAPLALSIPLAELDHMLWVPEAVSFQASKPDLASVIECCPPSAELVVVLPSASAVAVPWAGSIVSRTWSEKSENDCAT